MEQKNNWIHAKRFGRKLLNDTEPEYVGFVAERLEKYYKPGMKVLDAGCGSGIYAKSFLILDENVDYKGVDITPPYIDMAKDYFKEHKNLNFEVGDVTNLENIKDDQFDLGVSFAVWQHLPRYEDALRELMRVTKEYIIVKANFGNKTTIRIVKGGEMDDGYEDLEFYDNIYDMNAIKAKILETDKFGAIMNVPDINGPGVLCLYNRAMHSLQEELKKGITGDFTKQKNNWKYAKRYGHGLLYNTEPEKIHLISRYISKYYRPGMKVLDAGCDSGVYAHSFFLMDKDVDYMGVDITPLYIDMAREHFKEYGNMKFEVGDITNLDEFKDDQFDLTFCFNVIRHLPGYEDALNELMRVTKEYIFIKSLFGDETVLNIVKGNLMDDGCEDLEFYDNMYSMDEIKTSISETNKFGAIMQQPNIKGVGVLHMYNKAMHTLEEQIEIEKK